jgi:hypothetical protein
MSVMRAVTARQPVASPRKGSELKELSASLAGAGLTLKALFGWQKTAFRRVAEVTASHVSLDCDGRSVKLPRSLVPAVKADQWLRFERRGDDVSVSVDLAATLRAESRLSDLFQNLASVL